jgi:hypothetical protein
MVCGDVCVNLGGGYGGVAQEFLNNAQVGASFQQVGCKRMAEGVGADVLG